MKAFCANLKAIRGLRSQADFARVLGIPNQVTYHRYENGRIPRREILNDLATRLGVSADDLLEPMSPARAMEIGRNLRPSAWRSPIKIPVLKLVGMPGELRGDSPEMDELAKRLFKKWTQEDLGEFVTFIIDDLESKPQVVQWFFLNLLRLAMSQRAKMTSVSKSANPDE